MRLCGVIFSCGVKCVPGDARLFFLPLSVSGRPELWYNRSVALAAGEEGANEGKKTTSLQIHPQLRSAQHRPAGRVAC